MPLPSPPLLRLGLFGVGLDTYWPQFSGLRDRLAQHALMIWAPADIKLQSANVAFRKRFSLTALPDQATLYLFADVRYLLWINGDYVLRGPARFKPKGP